MDVRLTPAIRYWDLDAHKIAGILQELKETGSRVVGAFVPWAHLEADRRQSLRKFLKQATQFGLEVRLFVTPELGVGVLNGGVPEDLLARSENLARDRTGQTIFACAPPNIHPVVNLNAPPVFQRYGHFLLKVSQEVQEAVQDSLDTRVELVVGDSLFKHHYTLGLPEEDHGDFSPLFFQKELDYLQGWTPAQAERMFLARAVDFLSSRFERSAEVRISRRNLWGRSVSLDRLADELVGAVVDPRLIFQALERARPRCDAVCLDGLLPNSGKSRAFLVSSALAMYGDVWLNAETFLTLSPGFRRKMATFGESLSGEGSQHDRPVLCIVQNRFAPARLANALHERLGSALQIRSSLSEIKSQEFARVRMMVVEDALVIDHEQFLALMERARAEGMTIAMFRSSLAKRSLAEISCLEKFRLKHGWNYEVSLFPSGGQLITIEGHEDKLVSMDMLAERLLAVAEVEGWCRYVAEGVSHVSFQSTTSNSERLLFFINVASEPRKFRIRFHREAKVEGLEFRERVSEVGAAPAESLSSSDGEELESTLPAWSVVPVHVYRNLGGEVAGAEPAQIPAEAPL